MRVLVLSLVLAACTVFFATASLRAGDDGEKKPKRGAIRCQRGSGRSP